LTLPQEVFDLLHDINQFVTSVSRKAGKLTKQEKSVEAVMQVEFLGNSIEREKGQRG